MRANLTAPALATWLVIGTVICIVWSTPWYVGVLGGLTAAIFVYWALVALEPKWDLIPEWGWNGLSATLYTTIAIWMPTSLSSLVPLKWLYALMAAWFLYICVRGYLRRNEPKTPQV